QSRGDHRQSCQSAEAVARRSTRADRQRQGVDLPPTPDFYPASGARRARHNRARARQWCGTPDAPHHRQYFETSAIIAHRIGRRADDYRASIEAAAPALVMNHTSTPLTISPCSAGRSILLTEQIHEEGQSSWLAHPAYEPAAFQAGGGIRIRF